METDNKIKNDNRVCRALISPSNDSEEYDFEAVAVPHDNGQMKYSYRNDEYFMQVLRATQENINSARLDSGLPLFDNHPWDNSASNTLGITTSYFFDERGLVVRCKWGSRADQALRDDVKNGIIKTVSIEGSIDAYEIKREAGKLPQYLTAKWTPESLSFAPVPNDISSQIEVKRALDVQLKRNAESVSFSGSLKSKFN